MFKVFAVFSVIYIAVGLLLNAHASTSSLSITETKLTQSEIIVAKQFGLQPKEWRRYQLLKQGPAGLKNPNMHPAMMLGLFARTDRERQHFAQVYARNNAQYLDHFQKWQSAYLQAFHSQFPNAKVIDQSRIEWVKQLTKKPSVEQSPVLPLYVPKSQDSLALFINRDCDKCVVAYKRLRQYLPKIKLHLHFKDFSRDDIIAWARKNKVSSKWIKKKIVTLNHANREVNAYEIVEFPTTLKKSFYESKFTKVNVL